MWGQKWLSIGHALVALCVDGGSFGVDAEVKEGHEALRATLHRRSLCDERIEGHKALKVEGHEASRINLR